MKLIQVLRIGAVDERLTEDLCAELAAAFRAECVALVEPFDPSPARHPERSQYHSTEILARMEKLFLATRDAPSPAPAALVAPPFRAAQSGSLESVVASPLRATQDGGLKAAATKDGHPQAQPGAANASRLLGVTALDLYIPTLTFVFGEAQLAGPCAVVSTYRLRQEFYGLAPDPHLLGERLLKEAVHELGHTLNLRHCDDYRCAMAPSHAVEWIDLKTARFCPACQAQASVG
jgi:Peptidase family M54